MNKQRLLTLSLILAGAFGAAHADGLTREQVRAETLAAARAGQIPHGDLDQRAAEPAAAGTPMSVAQVRAELAQAVAAGSLEVGETGRTQREIEPGRYPQAPAVAGLTRSDVRRELVAAIRQGQLPQGDLDRTQADIAPQRYAASKHGHAVM